jgi:Fur family ferric uptake transcriptional regulator
MNMNLKEKLTSLLKTSGLKTTQERLSILEVLSKSKKPLSIKSIKESLKKTPVDQATIYRTIETLIGKQVIRPVNFQHDHNHYEIIDNSHHHHLICEKCGKVVDISSCNTNSLEQKIKQIGNFATINSHALEFFGLCKSCNKK